MQQILDSGKMTILLKNIEIISKLQPYDKLNTNDDIFYIDSGYLQCFIRYYYGSNRFQTIKKLYNILETIQYICGDFKLSQLCSILNEPIPLFSGNNKTKREKLIKYRAKIKYAKLYNPYALEIYNNWSSFITGLKNLIITYTTDVEITNNLNDIITKLCNLY